MVFSIVLKGCGIGVVKWDRAGPVKLCSNEGHRFQNQSHGFKCDSATSLCRMSSSVIQMWEHPSNSILKIKQNNTRKAWHTVSTQWMLALAR